MALETCNCIASSFLVRCRIMFEFSFLFNTCTLVSLLYLVCNFGMNCYNYKTLFTPNFQIIVFYSKCPHRLICTDMEHFLDGNYSFLCRIIQLVFCWLIQVKVFLVFFCYKFKINHKMLTRGVSFGS
jgi:hypothetical protein